MLFSGKKHDLEIFKVIQQLRYRKFLFYRVSAFERNLRLQTLIWYILWEWIAAGLSIAIFTLESNKEPK